MSCLNDRAIQDAEGISTSAINGPSAVYVDDGGECNFRRCKKGAVDTSAFCTTALRPQTGAISLIRRRLFCIRTSSSESVQLESSRRKHEHEEPLPSSRSVDDRSAVMSFPELWSILRIQPGSSILVCTTPACSVSIRSESVSASEDII